MHTCGYIPLLPAQAVKAGSGRAGGLGESVGAVLLPQPSPAQHGPEREEGKAAQEPASDAWGRI